MSGWLTQIIVAVISAGLGGGLAALLLVPRQRRLMDARTKDVIGKAYDRLVDQLQDDVAHLRRQLGEERHESEERLKECREQTRLLRAENSKLRNENAQLRAKFA